MFSAKRIPLASVLTLAALSWTPPLIAAESSDSQPSPAVAAPAVTELSRGLVLQVSEVLTMRRTPFGSKPVSLDLLAAKRGGDRVSNDAQLKGVVSDNQVTNATTGTNVISDGAFTGSAGLSTVIQNSGNNVLIQSATIVNVQVK
jgi:hypothetical protein